MYILSSIYPGVALKRRAEIPSGPAAEDLAMRANLRSASVIGAYSVSTMGVLSVCGATSFGDVITAVQYGSITSLVLLDVIHLV